MTLTLTLTRFPRFIMGFMGLSLTTLLLAAVPVFAKTQKNLPLLLDYLPPVASINAMLDPNRLQADSDNILQDSIEPVALSAISSGIIKTLKTHDPIKKLDTDLGIRQSNSEFQTLLQLQKYQDETDLAMLWESTVENSPVIRFSLEKIATPTELRFKKSSVFLRKSLGMMISGASMGASLIPGGSSYRTMGIMAGGDAMRNLTQGRMIDLSQALTPTEQIQLAGMVDDIQGRLIHTYHDYKNTLQALSNAHHLAIKNSNLFSKAKASGSDVAVMAAGTAYYKALLNETALRQKAIIYRLQLERLAGKETVDKLQLSVDLAPEISSTALPPVTERGISDRSSDRSNAEKSNLIDEHDNASNTP